MLFILQVLRELTLPLLTDTEITCTGVDIKILRQALRKGPQKIAIAKGGCGHTRTGRHFAGGAENICPENNNLPQK